MRSTDAPRVLLASPRMQHLAEEICRRNRAVVHGTVSWKRFPDEFPNIFVTNMDDVRKSHVSLLACFDTPDTIFEQVSLIYTLATAAPETFRIILPYFPTGTMERVDNEGQVATAATLAQMLSALAPAGPGPVPLYIYDIHALPIRHYFGPHIAPRFKTGTKLLKKRLEQEDVAIAFPDEGSWKRFKSMFQDASGKPLYPFIVCHKVRGEGDERVVKVSQGDPRGRHVVIVDDLIHSGGTTIECMNALKEAGAREVSAYATHGVMEKQSWRRLAAAGFSHLWITDSCPTADEVKDQNPFDVLSLVDSITNAIFD